MINMMRNMQPASPERIDQIKRNRRKKNIIGLLLLLVAGYVVLSNLELGDLPWVGFIVAGPSTTCTEIRGPQTMTDTEIRDLKIDDLGFQALRNENKATITIVNRDDQKGEVKVILYCRNGEQQGEQTKNLEPGETAVYNFLDVPDCDLDYIIEPDIIKTRVEKTVYLNDTVCQ